MSLIVPGPLVLTATRTLPFCLLLIFISVTSAVAQPTISSFSPTSGPVGTAVTITGNNFSATPANNIVFFGSVRASVSTATTSSLTVVVPAGATYQPITVTANGLTAYSAGSFIITFPGGAITSASFEYATNADDVTGLDTDDLSIADMDGDGKPDLVVVDKSNGFFAFYKNTSSGSTISFAPRTNYQAGNRSQRIAVGDIDGDGKPDVAVANTDDNNISVFRNTTSGGIISFAPKTNLAAGDYCIGICMADFDLDGKPDLATVSTNLNGTITILRNTSTVGSISFAPKVDFNTLGVLSTITASDIDNDGKADLVITNFATNIFAVLRNTSTGGTISFAAGVGFNTGPNPDRLVAGDIDGDGKSDIVITYFSTTYASVYRNSSAVTSITFTPRTDYTATSPGSATITDFDGDGKVDLAVLNDLESITLFKNTGVPGNISLTSVGNFTGLGMIKIMACDFNADNKPDLAELRGAFRVSVWRNETTEPQITSFSPVTSGSGATITITGANFTGATSVSFGGSPASSFTIVNSNTITAIVGSGASGTVSVTAPHGTGTKDGYSFVPNPVITSFTPTTGTLGLTITIRGDNFTGATAVSFGGVPAASFTIVNTTTITAVVGSGASGNVSITTPGGTAILGGFTYIPMPDVISFTPTTGTIETTVTITGTNFTGATDVRFGGIPAGSFTIVSSTTISAVVLGGASGYVKITTPGGSDSLGGFTFIQPPAPVITSFAPTNGPSGTVVTIAGNNFNTNAALNFVYFGPARAAVSSASATSLTVTIPPGAAYSPISVTTNFLTTNSNSPFIVTFPDGGAVSSNSFEGPITFAASASPLHVCISDVDGDGKNDLVSANDFSSSISVLRNTSITGTISFAPKMDFYSNSDAWHLLSSEIDGDGKKDMVVINNDSKKLTILKNTSVAGSISFAPYWTYSLTQDPWDIAAADFDNDGKIDLALVSYYSLSVIRNTSVVNNISLAPRIDIIVPSSTIAISTGDVDGDGKTDIVYLNNARDSVYILRNTTSGGTISFAAAVGYPSKSDFSQYYGPTDVTIGDLDHDGKPEIIVANTNASQSVSILKNNSTPGVISFPSRIDVLTGNIQPDHLSIEDIDGDGKPDISMTHEYVPRSISIIKNISTTGNIAFAEHVDFTDNGNSALSGGICTGDLDGDGRPEIIAGGGNTVGNLLYVFKNKTNGPHITSFTPGNGIAGQSITVTGLNFIGVTTVKFGGVAAASFIVNSPASITAVLANGASGNVTVTNAISTASAPGFLYGLAPTITSFTPTSGATGAVITIAGTNFTGATNVSFGGQSASSFTVVSPTTITASVWLGASGSVSVTVPGGTASLAGFTYIPPAPVINSFAPQSGSAGTSVTISGSNFTGTTNVAFGGMPASSFTLFGPSLLTAIVGNGTSGSVNVTTAGGTGSKTGFTFVQTTITSFTPTTGIAGTTVTITGTNFTGANAVSFGGVAATSFTVVNATTISAVVGTGESGNIGVTSPTGTATLSGFTFIPSPVISSFTPAIGATGATITITGTNLSGATTVSFGGIAASSFAFVNATTITAIVGTGASGNISVATPGGIASLSGFTYNTATAVGDPNNINSKDLLAYPNPSDNDVLIKHPARINASIRFVDILGREVKKITPARNSKETQTDVIDLMAGIYQIIWTDGQKTLSRIFMVK